MLCPCMAMLIIGQIIQIADVDTKHASTLPSRAVSRYSMAGASLGMTTFSPLTEPLLRI